MTTSSPRASVLGLLLAAAAATIAAQEAPVSQEQRFRAGTTLVPVDVRVVDGDGRPVIGLQASDFAVLEDEVPQEIAHFSPQVLVAEAPLATPAGPRPASSAFELTSSRQRTFLIVLGRGRLQPPSGGVDAALHLVRDRLLPQDQVAVLAWNRATEFTTDRDRVLRVLERFKRAHEGIEMRIVLWERSLQSRFNFGTLPDDVQREIDVVFGGPRGSREVAAELDDVLDQETVAFHDVTALYLGVEYLRHLAGEKHLLFVSEFGVALRGVDGDRHLGRLAADARVALDVIHAGGVPFGMSNGLSGHPPGLGMPQAMTGRALARLTGGSFFHHKFANASMDVDAIDAVTRSGYLLGYYPSNGEWDGRYRRIAVTVDRPGLTVMHRDGYFARRDMAPLDRRSLIVSSRMATAASTERRLRDLNVTIARAESSTSGDAGRVELELTVDASRLHFDESGGFQQGAFDVAVFCAGRDDEPVGEARRTVELTYTDARLTQIRKDGVTVTMTVPVAAEPQNVKIVVYDYEADLLGTAAARVTRAR